MNKKLDILYQRLGYTASDQTPKLTALAGGVATETSSTELKPLDLQAIEKLKKLYEQHPEKILARARSVIDAQITPAQLQ